MSTTKREIPQRFRVGATFGGAEWHFDEEWLVNMPEHRADELRAEGFMLASNCIRACDGGEFKTIEAARLQILESKTRRKTREWAAEVAQASGAPAKTVEFIRDPITAPIPEWWPPNSAGEGIASRDGDQPPKPDLLAADAPSPAEIAADLRDRSGACGGGFTHARDVADYIECRWVKCTRPGGCPEGYDELRARTGMERAALEHEITKHEPTLRELAKDD